MEEIPEQPGLVFGIGDEALYALAGVVGIGIGIIIFMVWALRDRDPPEIHPLALEIVSRFRSSFSFPQEGGERERDDLEAIPRPRNPPDSFRGEGGDEDACPICLSQLSFAIQTNCNHHFCATCILGYRAALPSRQFPCPCCRRNITLLQPWFSEQEYGEGGAGGERDPLLRQIREFNGESGGIPRSLVDQIQDIPSLLTGMGQLLTWRQFCSLYLRLRPLVVLLMCFLYFISPLDIIPEAAFGVIGLVDDVIILFLTFLFLLNIFVAFLRRGEV
mmetsp:Transcript_16791/g.47352  ORF Transcript_16791/g.47352 Transcript_16791/m.47352 type:complete len:275 (+) Transcript_16791:63-887(+)|eukprot:CAMPEP_0119130122 /NCGR_PEP_ID=MMETSP1310-20130426/7584_1 /TAXON_ID=464262 /ORGANISM="Genus nov. species nov., Strain RCC2339" /LENGTH=274 /DNA_ID=CAMNT_0007120599 /DNA_START=149 /DNA_END=973 /DNA_ORIENTATION=-